MHFCGVDREQNFTIRRLSEDERQAALDLAWGVFSEYESPDYSAEGTEEFRKCLHDEAYLSGLHYYGAFDGEKLIGEIAIRPDRKHICFFFVDGRYHRRGVCLKTTQRRRSPSILPPTVFPSIRRLGLCRPMKKRQ